MALTFEELKTKLLKNPELLPLFLDQLINMMQNTSLEVTILYDELAKKFPTDEQIQSYAWIRTFAMTMSQPWKLGAHEPIFKEMVSSHTDKNAKFFVARLFLMLAKAYPSNAQVVESFERVFTIQEGYIFTKNNPNPSLTTDDILKIGGALVKDSPKLDAVFWKHYRKELVILSRNLRDFIDQSDFDDECHRKISHTEKDLSHMERLELDYANGLIKIFLDKIEGKEPITSADAAAFLNDKYVEKRLDYLSKKSEQGNQLVSDLRLLLNSMSTEFSDNMLQPHSKLVRSTSLPNFFKPPQVAAEPKLKEAGKKATEPTPIKPVENPGSSCGDPVRENRSRVANAAAEVPPDRPYSPNLFGGMLADTGKQLTTIGQAVEMNPIIPASS
jgi:hypothetical protein